MKIGIDIDEVCLELVSHWLDKYKEITNDPIEYSQLIQWNLTPLLKDPDVFYALLPSIDYNKLGSVKDAVEGCVFLQKKGHELFFITTFDKNIIANHKFLRMESLGFPVNNKNFISCYTKNMIAVDRLIDDGYHNVINIRGGILFNRPSNSNCEYNPRVNSWRQIIQNHKTLFNNE